MRAAISKFTVSLALLLMAAPANGQYATQRYWTPGSAYYGQAWRQPYYGYPYPVPSAPRGATPRRAPRQEAWTSKAPPPARRAYPGLREAPAGRADAASEPPGGYRYEGGTIVGPEGPAYRAFGALPSFGTPYARYGNRLYGPGSNCQLFGNTALCW